jgi:predicted Rdx family selenoprotein
MIAKTLKVQKLTPAKANKVFMQMCQDILASETSRVGSKTNQDRVKQIVRELVAKELGTGDTANSADQSGRDDFAGADIENTIERESKQKEKRLMEV